MTIQRKVFIANRYFKTDPKDSRQKRKSGRSDVGEGDRNVGTMMADAQSRYFQTKDELFQYAQGQTEDIGYVKAKPAGESTWVRLPPGLLVLGEEHNKTTLTAVVKAVGTKKFMYEGYTERPEDLRPSGLSGLEAAMQERFAELDKEAGVARRGHHFGESFYPKVLRGLYGLPPKIGSSKRELILLKWAIRAVRLYDEGSDVAAYYGDHYAVLDALAESLQEWLDPRKVEVFEAFRELFAAHANAVIERERSAATGRWEAFIENWDPGEQYQGAKSLEINQAELMRDFSMYQHILTAKAQGYRLYGLGDKHHESLAGLLDAERITHMTMKDFLAQQGGRHPDR